MFTEEPIDENKRVIDLTVKEFKSLLPKQEEDEEELITTEELMKRLNTKNKNTVYNYSHQGMKSANRGRGKWSWSDVKKFFKQKYGLKKANIWDQK